jgi:hypothetical protein
MKTQEFRKLIREEVRKVLKEAAVNPYADQTLTGASITYDDYIIMDQAIGEFHGKFVTLLIKNLKDNKITKCTVKPGELDSGYKGLYVDLTLQNGVKYKLFFDSEEFAADVTTIKGMSTKPDNMKLTQILNKYK